MSEHTACTPGSRCCLAGPDLQQLEVMVRGVMSLHKLSAGDGYTYLTRQVAVQDSTERGLAGLGEYYSERGESPGVWLGRGLAGLDGFDASGPVSERQMVALFGEGRHPDADLIEQQAIGAGESVKAALRASQLGSVFRVEGAPGQFRVQLAGRFAAANEAAGRPRHAALPEEERARIRTELGRELFAEEHGRAPADARELSGFLACTSRPASRAVAGYDLTFTPVKSVSALWAVAPDDVAEVVEQAHGEAVRDALTWLEEHAAYTRLGAGGVRQVEVRGLIAAAFVHRDSRAGDPNLHTHVAVSNKVQVASGPGAGRWLALDGRPLHQFAVAAAERYTTRLEALLADRLGVRFADRPGTPAGKRPVREVVGVDPRLLREWSSRRAAIDVRRGELAVRFQAQHGRPPTPVEAVKLAQQATLETRQGKHAARSRAEQRATWQAEAQAVLGGSQQLPEMLRQVQQPARARRAEHRVEVTPEWVTGAAHRVLETVQAARATWREAHLRAEAERVVRAAHLSLDAVDDAVEQVLAAALQPELSVPLHVGEPVPAEPGVLRRADGSSVYRTAGNQQYTSAPVLAAERALLNSAGRPDGRAASRTAVELALLEAAANRAPLNAGQAELVRQLATSGARVQLALAAAGTGKTTALRVLARAWTDDGGTVLGLAPSATAAAVLREELGGAPTDTLAKLLWSLERHDQQQTAGQDGPGSGVAEAHATARSLPGAVPSWVEGIGPGTLVVLDEAGMAGTVELARAVEFVVGRGGSVRLVGDDAQLASVGAGGVLRDLAADHGAVTLSEVVRFADPAEGPASLALRDGNLAGLGFYLDHERVHVGDPASAAEQAYVAWQADRAAGLDALLLAPMREQVAALNARARADRLAALQQGQAGADGAASPSAGREVRLADSTAASASDTILTRRNERRLALGATDWVKNGDRWTVAAVRDDGALAVVHSRTGRTTVLPAAYVAEHVQLGYASTVHAAQGVTADACHLLVSGAETRQLLYVALTRGRTANHLYVATAGDGDEHRLLHPDETSTPTAVELLGQVLARDGAQASATTTARQLADPAARLGGAAARYADSLTVAVEQHLGPDGLERLDQAGEHALLGLTEAPAWPALRAELALLTLQGQQPDQALNDAIRQGELRTASDMAAVLHARLQRVHSADRDHIQSRQIGDVEVPWLPAVPAQLAADPTWGDYLSARHAHVLDLGSQVADAAHSWTSETAPGLAQPLLAAHAPSDLLGQLAAWRARHDADQTDLRPTGPPAPLAAHARAQQQLDAAVRRLLDQHDVAPTDPQGRWKELARQVHPRLLDDPTWPQLAAQLTIAERKGADVPALLRDTLADGPLPDELPAAALASRLVRCESNGSDTGTTPPAAQQPRRDVARSPSSVAPDPAQTWLELGRSIDPRLVAGPDWRRLAHTLQRAHVSGYDVAQNLPRLAAQAPLPADRPALTLEYRLVEDCPDAILRLPAHLRYATAPAPTTPAHYPTPRNQPQPRGIGR